MFRLAAVISSGVGGGDPLSSISPKGVFTLITILVAGMAKARLVNSLDYKLGR
jgi:hypothetical protein